jgi:fibronectin-binding autotransporter adhesin
MNGARRRRPRSALRRNLAAAVAAAAVWAFTSIPAPALAATINVSCPAQNLQTKIDAATAGSTLLITGTCRGTFLVDKDLTLKGDPTATLDGNGEGSTLFIPNVHTVHLISLTITGGVSPEGAGIDRPSGGTLTLSKVAVQFNLASGTGFVGGGGILAGSGPVVLTKSSVTDNRAVAQSTTGATALGGGIFVNGRLTLTSSTVSSNRVVGDGQSGSTAQGGGIYGGVGQLQVKGSHIDDNRATSISPAATTAFGGGVKWNSSGADLVLQGSTVSGNIATASMTAGSGGASVFGGGLDLSMDEGTVTDSTLANNRATATSSGGDAQAFGGGMDASWATGLTVEGSRIVGSRIEMSGPATGALGGGLDIVGPLVVRTSTISGSRVVANAGVSSANVEGGGIDAGGPFSLIRSTVDGNHITVHSDGSLARGRGAGVNSNGRTTIVASTISRNTVDATTPSNGPAQAQGVGLHLVGSPNSITNSTIASNVGHAAASASTGTASGLGGGLRSVADAVLTNTTVARNLVGGSASTKDLRGGGIQVEAGTTRLKATILALNTGPVAGGKNCSGTISSLGHNVVGTTVGCQFVDINSDQLNKDPKLGPLANNGGPTLTLALLAGSPALNVIPPALCAVAVDQRGIHRPQGPRCDVGSFERKV